MKEKRRTDAMKIKDQLMNLYRILLVIHSTSLMFAKAESRFHTMSKRTRMPWIKGGGGIKHVLYRCVKLALFHHTNCGHWSANSNDLFVYYVVFVGAYN